VSSLPYICISYLNLLSLSFQSQQLS